MENEHDIWNQIKDRLNQLNSNDAGKMKAFFFELNPELFSENEFVLSTTSAVICDFVEKKYLSYIKESLSIITGREYVVRIVIQQQNASPTQNPQYETAPSTNSPHYPPSFPEVVPSKEPSFYPSGSEMNTYDLFNEGTQERLYTPEPLPTTHHVVNTATQVPFTTSYNDVSQQSSFSQEGAKTFENFVVGDTNKFAYSLAYSVAENPGDHYNPLFIYGKSGLGKTHLLLAIKNFINHNHPYLKVGYAQIINFVNDYTTTLQTKQWDVFTIKYRLCDVLLLDDIQNLEGKTESTNEIFTIFNNMISQGKHIILSADRAPKNIDLDERFTSRFSAGIIADIKPPTFETKLAIFKNCINSQCRNFGIDSIYIPEEVYTRVVELSNSNIRNLEGAATTLVAHMSTRNSYSSITVDEAEEVVNNIFLRSNKKNITVGSIQREVENYYHISHADMIGSKRSQNISHPRQIAMYLSRMMTDISYPEIAKMFGGKNHTSVLYAVNTIETKRMTDYQINGDIENLMGILEE